MNRDIIILILIAIAVIFLVISIIKKAVKLVFTIIIILVAVTLFDIFIKGNSPLQEIKAYKTNFTYGKDIGDLTVKVKDTVYNLQSDIKSYNGKKESNELLIKENKKLHSYLTLLDTFKHTDRLNTFHNKYRSYLTDIVDISDSTVKVAEGTSKAVKMKDEQQKNLENIIDKLDKVSETVGK